MNETAIDQVRATGLNAGCDTCAFRKGSTTRGEPWNVIRAQVCAEGAVPFYCHHGINNWDHGPSTLTREELRRAHICEGWKETVRRRSKNPAWRKERRLKHALAELCLGALELWQTKDQSASDKKGYEREWKRLFRWLFNLDRYRVSDAGTEAR